MDNYLFTGVTEKKDIKEVSKDRTILLDTSTNS